MLEAGAISALMGSINQAIGMGKVLRDSDKAFDQAEFKMKMSDLVDRLVEVREQLQSNREENLQLREEILKLKQEIGKKANVIFENGKYWVLLNDGKKDGPYCQKCLDKDEKLIRLNPKESDRGNYWSCTTCTQSYDLPPFRYYGNERQEGLTNWM